MQCLPRNSDIHSTENCMKKFAKVDHIFTTLGLSENNKSRIYELLASILHLGNVEFRNGSNGQVEISESS